MHYTFDSNGLTHPLNMRFFYLSFALRCLFKMKYNISTLTTRKQLLLMFRGLRYNIARNVYSTVHDLRLLFKNSS